VAFVKEKACKTGDMDQDDDTDPPNNISPDNINMDELDLVEDVSIVNEEVDGNDEGWEMENGESSDSKHSMDEDEDED
jgi:hypothetical protein